MSESTASAAQNVYGILCAALDDMEWKYQKNDDALQVCYGVSGEHMEMQFCVEIDQETQRIRLCSVLPFPIACDRRMEAAVAINAVNRVLSDGQFLLNLKTGRLSYRMVTRFQDAKIGKELFLHFIRFSHTVVNVYNDRFEKLSEGTMTLAEFLKEI